MSLLRSYPKIYNLGHKAVEGIFDGPVQIEEKVDGSQFSFGVREKDGELLMRSKNAFISHGNPPKMFESGVKYIVSIRDLLTPGWTYRCEFLDSPKHNTLVYSRLPQNHLVLFDVDKGMEDFFGPDERALIADTLGIDCVPVIYNGKITLTELEKLLQRESFLGGPSIEGVVVKAYGKWVDGETMMGKYVTEQFKESHAPDWKLRNPSRSDVVLKLIEALTTEARWEKAIQHLREAGLLQDSPSDIGLLMKEVNRDVLEDETDRIKDALFKYIWPQIARGVTKGLPNWYKERLLKQSFTLEEKNV